MLNYKNKATLSYFETFPNTEEFYSASEPGAPLCLQTRQELTQLLEVIDQLQPKTIVEIGVNYGGSLYQWMKHLKPKTTIIAIDIKGGPFCSVDYNQHPPDYSNFNRWAEEFNQDFHMIWGNSSLEETRDSVLKITNSIDFLFIDGDHSYPGVKKDFILYRPLVNHGGLIALHDIANQPGCDGVSYLWKEIRQCGFIVRELWSMRDQDKVGYGTGLVFV